MNSENLIASAQTTINASPKDVWNALITPEVIKKYMFGTTVISDWKQGSDIVWKGEWEGKPYEDKGKIQELIPNEKFSYTHSSASADTTGNPEALHLITIKLNPQENRTKVTLTQDHNASEKEQKKSEENWNTMLNEMKKVVEGKV